MSSKRDQLEDYPLFYEEIGSLRSDRSNESSKKESPGRGGLNEDQLAKLSDDLRSPMKDSLGDSNPLQ